MHNTRRHRAMSAPLLLALLVLWPALSFGHGTPRQVPAGDSREIHFPDTASYKTLVADLHTHSVFSDGHVWPRIRVEEALRDGLDALAITEHLEYQPHRFDIPHADRNRAVQEAQEAAAGTNLMVIAGSEITREAPAGHINAVFINDANALFNVPTPPADAKDAIAYYTEANKWPAQDAVDAANAQGAFVFWNHPYWTRQRPDGIARINDFHRKNARDGKVHGIEIANGQDYSEEALAIALKHDLALIGVSDVHDLIDWDHPPHAGEHRPVTLVLAETRSAAGIREALFARRTVVWFRNLLIGRPAELLPLIEASLSVSEARFRPDTQVLDFTIGNASDAVYELHNTTRFTFMDHGDRIRIPANGDLALSVKPGERSPATLDLVFEVENALTAPKKHPRITLTITLPAEPAPPPPE